MSKNLSYPKFRIKEIIKETPDSITMELDSDQELIYQAGQFITLVFLKENGTEERRSYSFSSAPVLNEPNRITIKKVANGEYSRELLKAEVGDTLHYSGINGLFTLPQPIETYQHYFFIAAGSGITPIFSLIKTLLFSSSDIKINLIYSNKSEEAAMFYQEIKALAKENTNRLHVQFLFSNASEIRNARLSNSLLVDYLPKHRLHDWRKCYFYVCGPFDYMDTVMITLLTEGIPLENIRKENFSHILPEIKEKPRDTQAHQVTILRNEKSISLTVQYPQSILDVALKQGYALPHSCHSGQCGSCAAICKKGKVWMSYNEVLTKKDLDSGLILTCTGFPIEGDVELVF